MNEANLKSSSLCFKYFNREVRRTLLMTTQDRKSTMSALNTYDSKWHIFALCLFAAISPLVMMTTPVLAYELGVGWQLAPSQVGKFFFYEQLYMGFAAIPAIWWAKRFSARSSMKFFIGLFLLGNILSFFANDLNTLILARSTAAFSAGSILIITMASASMTSKPARTFALWLLGQTLVGAAAIAVLPKLFAEYGLHAFFILLAVLMVVACPFYRHFSDQVTGTQKAQLSHSSVVSNPLWKWVGVAAVLAFFTSISSIWTFLSSIGMGSKLDESTINNTFSLATLFGILGCFLASMVGHKVNRIIMIVSGFILFFISIALLVGQLNNISFMSAVFTFKFAWMFTFPFILGSLASIDENGGIMKFVSLVIGTGMAIGPVVSGNIIENSVGFSGLLTTAACLFAIALIFVTLLNLKNKQTINQPVNLAVK